MITFNALLPYLALSVGITGLLVLRSHLLLSALIFVLLAIGFALEPVCPAGFLALAAFWGICEFYWRYPHTRPLACPWAKSLVFLTMIALALGFANHMIPGFHNLQVLEGVTLSPSSTPFTMYLNFDKTMAALILAITSACLFNQPEPLGKRFLISTLKILVLSWVVLIPLAMLTGYVEFDPKFPEAFWLCAWNNLVFVCFAEEVIFRGIIQNTLMTVTQRWQVPPFISILITSILFGVLLMGHVRGGPIFIAFSTLAGIFYGYAYHITKRLEAAILVHFGVNLAHFLFFSYPMAASVMK